MDFIFYFAWNILIKSQNHSIIKSFKLEETFKIFESNGKSIFN